MFSNILTVLLKKIKVLSWTLQQKHDRKRVELSPSFVASRILKNNRRFKSVSTLHSNCLMCARLFVSVHVRNYFLKMFLALHKLLFVFLLMQTGLMWPFFGPFRMTDLCIIARILIGKPTVTNSNCKLLVLDPWYYFIRACVGATGGCAFMTCSIYCYSEIVHPTPHCGT